MGDSLRAPRASVTLDGAALPGVIEVDVLANNHRAADRFRVRLAASAVGAELFWGRGLVEVRVALGGTEVRLLQGVPDTVELDPVRGTLEVDGRDRTAAFLDSPTQESFANRTASEIAEILAARHGLRCQAERTGTLAGRYMQSQHDQITLNRGSAALTEWDLLVFLAEREGFDVFTDGDVLRFGPAAGDTMAMEAGACTALRLERSLALAGVEVTVKTWDSAGGRAVVQTARQGEGATHRQVIVRPNLPAAEAQTLAERQAADLARHAWGVAATMPGELALTPRSRVMLSGAGHGFDRTYSVAELHRSLDARSGFTQRVRLQAVPEAA